MNPPVATPLREATFRLTLTDGAPKLSAVSDGVQALLGYPAADFLSGRTALPSLIHPEDRDIADPLFSPALPGSEGECNLRLRQASGHILCVKGRYRREATAGGVVLELHLQDAKGLPRTMPAANTSPMFAAMMENTDDYIYFKDRNHVVTGASRTLVALCSPAEYWTDLLGQTDYDIFPEKLADAYYRLEKQIFAGLTVAHEVQKTLSKDGKEGWVDNRKYPIRDASGVLIGLYGIARDITERKQAEAALLASEAKARAIVDGSPVPIAMNDGNQRITYLNRAFTETFGYGLEDIPTLAEWWPKAYPDPAYRQEVAESWQTELARAAQTGTAFKPLDVNIRCKDGSERSVMVSAASLDDAFAGTQLVVLHDFTVHRLHEQALRESAMQLSLVIRGGDIGYWDWNFVTGGLVVNDRWLAIVGLDAQGPPPTIDLWNSLVHPEDRPKLVRAVEEVLFKPSVNNGEVEIRARHTAGHYVWILDKFSVVERAADGSPLRVVGTHVDITVRVEMDERLRQDVLQADRMRRALLSTLEDQKRTQAAVREREARYGAMVNSIADAIISADAAGQIIGWNPGAERIFGYAESEILGRPLLLLLPDRHHGRQTAEVARVMAAGTHDPTSPNVEVEGRRKDGREFPLKMSLSSWQIDGQKFFTTIVRDITQEKTAAANLATRMDELRRWQTATLGREGRVLELKREINALRASHGEPPRYPSALAEGPR